MDIHGGRRRPWGVSGGGAGGASVNISVAGVERIQHDREFHRGKHRQQRVTAE